MEEVNVSLNKSDAWTSADDTHDASLQEAKLMMSSTYNINSSLKKFKANVKEQSASKSKRLTDSAGANSKGVSGKSLRCTECGFRTSHRYSLLRHRRCHSLGATFRCPQCSFSSSNEISVTKHMHKAHSPVSSSSSNVNKGEHRNSVSGSISKSPPKAKGKDVKSSSDVQVGMSVSQTHYYCTHCSNSYSKRLVLKHHMKSVHGVSLDPWQCPCCSDTYITRVRLVNHIIAKHGQQSLNENLHKIESVSRDSTDVLKSKTEKLKNLEEANKCSPELHRSGTGASKGVSKDIYHCTFCSFSIKSAQDLNHHMESAHPNLLPFECQLCGFKTITESDIKQHLYQYHKSVSSTEYVELHKQKINELDFHAKDQRSNHLAPAISCDDSEKLTESNVHKGATLHTNCFTCKHCAYKTKWQHMLKKHLRTFHSNRPFQCLLCGIKTNLKGNVRQHLSRVHGSLDCTEFVDLTVEHVEPVNSEKISQPFLTINTTMPQNNSELQPPPAKRRRSRRDSFDTRSTATNCSTSADGEVSTTGHENIDNSEAESYVSSRVGSVKSTASHRMSPGSKRGLRQTQAEHCCTVCSQVLGSARTLYAHMKIHADLRRYKCGMCGMRSNFRTSILKHLSNVHKNTDDCSGMIIKLSMAVAKKTISRYRSHSQQTAVRHSASISDTASIVSDASTTKHNSTVNTHHHLPDALSSNRVSSDAKRPFRCNVCHLGFSHARILRNHSVIHTDLRRYMCNVCGWRTNFKGNMKAHFEKRHMATNMSLTVLSIEEARDTVEMYRQQASSNNKLNVRLGLCEKQSLAPAEKLIDQKSDATAKHTSTDATPGSVSRKLQNTDSQYKCEWCSMTFVTAAALRSHADIHTDYRRYRCNTCGWRTNFKGNMVTHVQNIHSNSGSYDTLSLEEAKETIDAYRLQFPDRKRKSFTDNLIVSVEDCGQLPISHSKSQLSTVAVNTDSVINSRSTESMKYNSKFKVARTQCHLCSKMFASVAVLRKHAVVHSDFRRYRCSACGWRTNFGGNMKKHLMNIHSGAASFLRMSVAEAKATIESYKQANPQWNRTANLSTQLSVNANLLNDVAVDANCSHNSDSSLSHAQYRQRNNATPKCDTQSPRLPNTSHRHSVNHTGGNKTANTFKCKICFETFKTAQICRSHAVTHMDIRRYQCLTCGWRTNYRGNVTIHLHNVHNMLANSETFVRLSAADAAKTVAAYKAQLPPTGSMTRSSSRAQSGNIFAKHRQRLTSSTNGKGDSLISRLRSGLDSTLSVEEGSTDHIVESGPSETDQPPASTDGHWSDANLSKLRRMGPVKKANVSAFRCQQCSFRTRLPSSLKKHREICHGSLLPTIGSEKSATELPAGDDESFDGSHSSETNCRFVLGIGFKPYMCSSCHFRMNWLTTMKKHVQKCSPSAKMLRLSVDEAKQTLPDYEKMRAMKKLGRVENTSVQQDVAFQSDTVEQMPELPSIQDWKIKPVRGLRQFKCSTCSFRSDWRSAMRRHISSCSSKARIIKLTEDEARQQTVTESTLAQNCGKSANFVRGLQPYKCSACSFRSDWRSAIRRHIRTCSSRARIVTLSTEEARQMPKSQRTPASAIKLDLKTRATESLGVDMMKLRRFSCSLCFYRSNYRCDIVRHLRQRHPSKSGCCNLMQIDEARSTLEEYMKCKSALGRRDSTTFRPKSSDASICSSTDHATAKSFVDNVKCGKDKGRDSHNLRQFACSHCDQRSDYKVNILKHQRRKHSGQSCSVIDLSEDKQRSAINEHDTGALTNQNDDLHSKGDHVSSSIVNSSSHVSEPTEKCLLPGDSNLKGIQHIQSGLSESFANRSGLRLYKCSACVYRANWLSTIHRHVRKCSPNAYLIKLSVEEAQKTVAVYEKFHARRKSYAKVSIATGKTGLSRANTREEWFDVLQLRRFSCSLCDYRSNYRYDVGKHHKTQHKGQIGTVVFMAEEEARLTLNDHFRKGVRRFRRQVDNPKESENTSESVKPDILTSKPETGDTSLQLSNESPVQDDAKLSVNEAGFASNICYTNESAAQSFCQYKCSACSYISKWKANVYKHRRRKHSKAHIIVLPLPTAASSSVSAQHFNDTIVLSKETCIQYKCSSCNFASKWKANVYKHRARRHPRAKVIKLSPPNVTALSASGTVVSNQADDNMNAAGIVHRSPTALDEQTFVGENYIHQRFIQSNHAPKPHVCSQCNFKTFYFSSLTRHEKTHHGGIDSLHGVVSTQPSLASQDAVSKNIRRRFIMTQGGVRLYPCSHCSFRSRWFKSLKRHLCSHHGIIREAEQTLSEVGSGSQESYAEDLSSSAKSSSDLVSYVEMPKMLSPLSNKYDNVYFRRYACPICHMRSNYRYDTERHIRNEHQGLSSTVTVLPKALAKQTLDEYVRQYGRRFKKTVDWANSSCEKELSSSATTEKVENENGIDLADIPCATESSDHVNAESQSDAVEKSDEISLFADQSNDNICQKEVGEKSLRLGWLTCDKCPFLTKYPYNMVAHKQLHRPRASANIKCHECAFWCSTQTAMLKHSKVHDPGYAAKRTNEPSCVTPVKTSAVDTSNAILSCNICPFLTKFSHTLTCHIALHQPNVDANYACDTCSFRSRDRSTIARHKLVHEPDYVEKRLDTLRAGGQPTVVVKHPRSDVTPVDRDDESETVEIAAIKQKLITSRFSQNVEEGKVSPAKTLTIQYLANNIENGRHSVDEISDVPDMSTQPSGEVLVNTTDVEVEGYDCLKQSHIWYCERCPYSSINKTHFKQHVMLHGRRLPYQCKYCNYSVYSYWRLAQHRRYHFHKNSHLLNAQSVSSLLLLPPRRQPSASLSSRCFDEHPSDLFENSEEFSLPSLPSFRCSHCPFSADHRTEFQYHMQRHVLPSEHSCPFCDFSTSCGRGLLPHVLLHFNLPGSAMSALPPQCRSFPAWKSVLGEIESYLHKFKEKFANEHDLKSSDYCSMEDYSSDVLSLSDGVQHDEVCAKCRSEPNNVEQPSSEFLQSLQLVSKHIVSAPVPSKDGSNTAVNAADITNICQFCDRLFVSSQQLEKHRASHLIGSHF